MYCTYISHLHARIYILLLSMFYQCIIHYQYTKPNNINIQHTWYHLVYKKIKVWWCRHISVIIVEELMFNLILKVEGSVNVLMKGIKNMYRWMSIHSITLLVLVHLYMYYYLKNEHLSNTDVIFCLVWLTSG